MLAFLIQLYRKTQLGLHNRDCNSSNNFNISQTCMISLDMLIGNGILITNCVSCAVSLCGDTQRPEGNCTVPSEHYNDHS